jgi:hypothetical protein
MLKKISNCVSRYGDLFQCIGLPVLKPVHESPYVVLTLFDDGLEFGIRHGGILLQVLVQVSGIQGHASVNCDVRRCPLEYHGDFVGRTNDGNNPFRILDPIQNLSLGVWITAVNFVEDDTGLAGVPSVLYERGEGDRSHTGITQGRDIVVRS